MSYVMEYTLMNLREALDNNVLKDLIHKAINRFNITSSEDVTGFLKGKAINHMNINLSATYLFLVFDEKFGIEILAYFTLVNNKVFSVKNANEEDRKIIFIDDDNAKHQAGILIAQLGRNSKYISSDIDINGIMNEIMIVIKNIIEIGGGRFIILDCEDHHIERYEKVGFKNIKKNGNTGLNTFIMYSEAIV